MSRAALPLRSLVCLSLIASLTSSASARSNGIAAHGCDGCHREEGAEVTLTPDTLLAPGEETTFTVRITGPRIMSGGLFIPQPSHGTLRALGGQGLAQVERALTHSQPKTAANDAVTFRFAWRAPDEPNGTTFEVYAVSANANRNASGDAPASFVQDFVYGCAEQTFYQDADSDGYGVTTSTIVRCEGPPPPGYASVGGDCDDYRAEVNPGAEEKCNKRDDNCNGLIDENAVPVELWPDGDGDGFYGSRIGLSIMGCVPTSGYAADPGDCDDSDPNVHPDAEEICNYIDDNCNGRVDERVRPRCGIGFCERESYTCSPDDCVAGTPSEERCNGLDFDCNGFIDDGQLCGEGEICNSGLCLTREQSGLGEEALEPEPDASGPGSSRGPDGPTSEGGCSWSTSNSPRFPLLLAALALFIFRRIRRHRSAT